MHDTPASRVRVGPTAAAPLAGGDGLAQAIAAALLIASLVGAGFAAALALCILMIPVVIRSSEEMLKIVPNDLREAALALGVPKWKVILRIVVPTAISGLITGAMLAVARVAGETAPLLLTTFLAQDINLNAFNGSQTSLPTFIWDQISPDNRDRHMSSIASQRR